MDAPINPVLVLILQGVSVLFSGLILFLINRLFLSLDQTKVNLDSNTQSTHSIALSSARTDQKVDTLVMRVEGISKRTHDLDQSVAELVAVEKIRGQQALLRNRRGND